MRTAQLSKTAANKRVRELEILLSDTTSAMHDALQFAIEDMLLRRWNARSKSRRIYRCAAIIETGAQTSREID